MAVQIVCVDTSLFDLGRVVATPAVLEALHELGVSPDDLLQRHLLGDWGDLSDSDKQANDAALTEGERIFSCYQFGVCKVYCITEHDRSVTTLCLAEEY